MPRTFPCDECGETVTTFMRVGETAICRNCGQQAIVPVTAEEIDSQPASGQPSLGPPQTGSSGSARREGHCHDLSQFLRGPLDGGKAAGQASPTWYGRPGFCLGLCISLIACAYAVVAIADAHMERAGMVERSRACVACARLEYVFLVLSYTVGLLQLTWNWCRPAGWAVAGLVSAGSGLWLYLFAVPVEMMGLRDLSMVGLADGKHLPVHTALLALLACFAFLSGPALLLVGVVQAASRARRGKPQKRRATPVDRPRIPRGQGPPERYGPKAPTRHEASLDPGQGGNGVTGQRDAP